MRHLLIILTMALLLLAPAACGSTTPEAPSKATESPPPAESGPGPEVPEPASGEPKAERPAEVTARDGDAPIEASGPGEEGTTTPLTKVRNDTREKSILEDGRGAGHDRMAKSAPDALPGLPAPPLEDSRHHYGSKQPREPNLKAGEVDDNDRWEEYLDFV